VITLKWIVGTLQEVYNINTISLDSKALTHRVMDSTRSLKVCCGTKMLAADPLFPPSCEVGATCQSNIHMDGRTQGFPAEHCPKHDTASAGSPSSHSASWCHVFSRTSINFFSNLSNSSSSVGSDHTGQPSLPRASVSHGRP
ncbi:hypothetical protein QTP70_017796, partial [Hemibagrus guttatus]